MANDQTFKIEDARIIFRNFSGKEAEFNPKGNRNFMVELSPDAAERMLADGWNVKYLKARDEEEDPTPCIQVSLGFTNYPPKIVMITSSGRTHLDEDTIETLDWAEFKNVDLIARAYHYDVRGAQGIKAYLKTMYVTIEEDELERKYSVKSDD